MSTEVDVSVFREHRTREELNSLLHYGHIIPVSRGWTRAYVEAHYPRWTWNALVKMFVAAGIFVNRGGAPPKCDDRVVMFHFSGPEEFFVEWADGEVPEDAAGRSTGTTNSSAHPGRTGVGGADSTCGDRGGR